MPEITEVREQVRHPRRRSIFVDGEYAFGASVDEVIEYGLAVGSEWTEEQVQALISELEVRRARDVALRLLGFRPRSEHELRSRLRQERFADAVADRAIADLQRLGYVNDEEFAGAWVRSRLAGGGAGRTRLAWELRSKGVDPRVIEGSLAGLEGEAELSLAVELAQRRYERLRSEEPEAQRRKLASFLQRRGFSYDITERALSQVLPPE